MHLNIFELFIDELSQFTWFVNEYNYILKRNFKAKLEFQETHSGIFDVDLWRQSIKVSELLITLPHAEGLIAKQTK